VPRATFDESDRIVLRKLAKEITTELEAFLAKRFESKISRMNESLRSIADVTAEIRDQKIKAPDTHADVHRVIGQRAKAAWHAERKDVALRRTGSTPTTLSSSSSKGAGAPTFDAQDTPLTQSIGLGLLIGPNDALLLRKFVKIIRDTLDMSIVYIAGFPISRKGNEMTSLTSPLGNRCIVMAQDGLTGAKLDLDYSSHTEAALRDPSDDEGVIIHELDRKVTKSRKGAVKASVDGAVQLFHTGLLVPIRPTETSQATNPTAERCAEAGFVIGAFSTNPSRALGIEDLRYLQKFAMLFNALLRTYHEALQSAIAEAKKSMVQAANPQRKKEKEKNVMTTMVAAGAEAVLAVPQLTMRGTVAATRSTTSALKTAASATASATKKTLRPHASKPTAANISTPSPRTDKDSLFSLDIFAKWDRTATPGSPMASMSRDQSTFSGHVPRSPLQTFPSNTSFPTRPRFQRAPTSKTSSLRTESEKPSHPEAGIVPEERPAAEHAAPLAACASSRGRPTRPSYLRTQSHVVTRTPEALSVF
jgi:hypothetical protein